MCGAVGWLVVVFVMFLTLFLKVGVITYILLCGFPPFFSSRKDINMDYLSNAPFWIFINKVCCGIFRSSLIGKENIGFSRTSRRIVGRCFVVALSCFVFSCSVSRQSGVSVSFF
jgi:hypothetical protein